MFSNFRKNDSNHQEKIFSLHFFAVALVLSIASFLMLTLINNGKKYESEISIIFLPKSEMAVLNSEQILENLENIPTGLSFYKKMLRENSEIGDSFSGFSEEKMKSSWNKNLEIKRKGKSSIIKISVKRNSQEEAKAISQAAVFNLLNTAGHYYDIKKDIDLRIIDGPIVSPVKSNVFKIILFSLALGFLISFVINSLLNYIFKKIDIQEKDNILTPQKNIPIKTSTVEKFKKIERENEEPKQKSGTLPDSALIIETPVKSAFAPENLPFVDENYFRNNIIKANGFHQKKEEETIKTEEKSKPTEKKNVENAKDEPANFYREPTKEELKSRLNKLLRGEL